MKRRAFLGFLLAAAGSAQDRESQDVLDMFADMAEGLSTANAGQFMSRVERSYSGYDDLRRNVEALVEQWDLAASIEPLRGSGSDTERSVEVDWFLELRAKAPSNRVIRRREVLTLKLKRSGKRWKIADLSSAGLFSAIVPEVLQSSPQ